MRRHVEEHRPTGACSIITIHEVYGLKTIIKPINEFGCYWMDASMANQPKLHQTVVYFIRPIPPNDDTIW